MSDGQLILLSLLSALALVVLVVALTFALYRIQASLERINVHAAKILWGVRAIERETSPLRAELPELRATLTDVVSGTSAIAQTLTQADRHLGAAAEALGGPRPAGQSQVGA